MQNFHWEGINRFGEKRKGTIQAASIALAKIELAKQGLTSQKIFKKRHIPFKHNKITQKDLINFTRQMATMFAAGISLVESINILMRGQKKEVMMFLLITINTDLKSGLTFAESLGKHPAYFNNLFCNLIDAGEKSGTLETMLNNIANYKEKLLFTKNKIKQVLTYPLTILAIATLVIIFLLVKIIPQFAILFHAFAADLPPLTRNIIYLSQFLQKYWLFLSLFLGSLISLLISCKRIAPNIAPNFANILSKLPFFANILKKMINAHFFHTLAITFSAGLPLLSALSAAAKATDSSIYFAATTKMQKIIATGHPLHYAMTETELFANLVVQMVLIGENTGTLEEMFTRIADNSTKEVDLAINAFNSLLEPILILILGLIIGFFIIALYVPISNLSAIVY